LLNLTRILLEANIPFFRRWHDTEAGQGSKAMSRRAREAEAFSMLAWLQAASMFAVALWVLCASFFCADADGFVAEEGSRR
jgi:hypothetical protein